MFALSYLIINQIILRLGITVGTLLYIWYYAVAADTPLWAAIWTSVIMGIANLIGLAQLLVRRSEIALPKRHKDIYHYFSTLLPGDFRDVVKLAERRTNDAPLVMTKEGEPVTSLYFLISGRTSVDKAGEEFGLPEGIFIGEVAYLTNRVASATTTAPVGSEILEWNFASLRRKAAKDSRFKLALEAVISNDMADKVTLAVPGRNYTGEKP